MSVRRRAVKARVKRDADWEKSRNEMQAHFETLKNDFPRMAAEYQLGLIESKLAAHSRKMVKKYGRS